MFDGVFIEYDGEDIFFYFVCVFGIEDDYFFFGKVDGD